MLCWLNAIGTASLSVAVLCCGSLVLDTAAASKPIMLSPSSCRSGSPAQGESLLSDACNGSPPSLLLDELERCASAPLLYPPLRTDAILARAASQMERALRPVEPKPPDWAMSSKLRSNSFGVRSSDSLREFERVDPSAECAAHYDADGTWLDAPLVLAAMRVCDMLLPQPPLLTSSQMRVCDGFLGGGADSLLNPFAVQASLD